MDYRPLAALGRRRLRAGARRSEARAPVDRRAVVRVLPGHGPHHLRRPGVAALVNERFVPVRVDADRRPDISERYSLGGWPTTAFLTATATSSAAART